MSMDSVGVRGTPKDGTTGKLPVWAKELRNKKGNSQSLLLEISQLDRTRGFKHEHYSRSDLAAANHAVEGQSHE